jgi:hypothetical protein
MTIPHPRPSRHIPRNVNWRFIDWNPVQHNYGGTELPYASILLKQKNKMATDIKIPIITSQVSRAILFIHNCCHHGNGKTGLYVVSYVQKYAGSIISWDVTPCSWVAVRRHFGRLYRLQACWILLANRLLSNPRLWCSAVSRKQRLDEAVFHPSW